MAKRLSSLFTHSKNDSISNVSNRSGSPILHESPTSSPDSTPHMGKILKKQPGSRPTSHLDLIEGAEGPLSPPSLVTEYGVRSLTRDGRPGSRAASQSTRGSSGSRPQTPDLLSVPGTISPTSTGSPMSTKLSKRKSWIAGKGDKNRYDEDCESPKAWIAGLKEHVAYDITPLLMGERVHEIWDEQGDVVVYLFPEQSAKGPSFKVSSTVFADSKAFSYLHEQPSPNNHIWDRSPIELKLPHLNNSMGDLALNNKPSGIPQRRLPQSWTTPNFSTPSIVAPVPPTPREKVVYLPLGLDYDYSAPESVPRGDDLELLVLYRNFFSFLTGGALISTPRQNSLYSVFMGISSILRRLQYGNDKGSSWGAVPWSSFSRYTEELRLSDVRSSREKNIEALVLGEAMRSWPLYNEGFAHAVGRLDDIKSIKSPKFGKISPVTLNRLDRANIDLQQRLGTVRTKLDNFDFPSMFSGIANSQTATEAKLVRFKAWKQAFLDYRAFTISHYKRRYGSWPPKASSKKNSFEESGLNRRLLKEVYQDFTDLYDMLVDRTQLTTRTTEMPNLADSAASDTNETIQHALRSVESEYDRSSPPVMPPIPFDVPLLPDYANSFNREHVLAKKEPGDAKKLKDNEINALLLGSYNRESIKPKPFCQEFLAYERKMGQGNSMQELVDQRCGQWLFIYAVLQSFPMLVVDARDLIFTEGVEYFLCMAPRGGRPWMKEDTSTSRAWYNVASGGGLISLPADLIDHSVEGIYRRSHCYEMANTWIQGLQGETLESTTTSAQAYDALKPRHSVGDRQNLSPYLTPTYAGSDHTSPRNSPLLRPSSSHSHEPNLLNLPGSRPVSRNSMHIGLEEVRSPPQEQLNRPTSVFNPNITFDNILGSAPQVEKRGKKGKK